MSAGISSADQTKLLNRWRPLVVYDSRESFRADSPKIFTDITDNPHGNTLRRATGEIVAAGDPKGWEQKYLPLDLEILDGTTPYAKGIPAKPGDYLDATGSSYAADARRMHAAHPELADKLCARVVQDGKLTWLQYHFFYYYNDMPLDWHEGDWEMIQIGLDANGDPAQLTCAQHRHCETRDWSKVETTKTPDGEVPVVYPAIGSHATYFEKGEHWRALINLVDHHDGGNPQTRVRPGVIEIDDQTPWIAWPGPWGGTKGKLAPSPVGPSHQGEKWTSPSKFAAEGVGFKVRLFVDLPEKTPPAPPAPRAPRLALVGDHAPGLRISTSKTAALPVAARVTLEPRAAKALPLTEVVPVSSGQTIYDLGAHGRGWKSARVSVISRDGGESRPARVDLG